jgi:hypothetical protein
MKRISIILVCALIAPLALAQAKRTKAQQTNTIQPAATLMTTGAVKVGTVTSFNPGQRVVVRPTSIAVQSTPDVKPMSYVLASKVRYVDKDGRAVSPSQIQPGARVQLGFDRRGRVNRVVVVEKY